MTAIEPQLSATSVNAGADAIPPALRRRGGTRRQVFAVALIGALVLAAFASGDLAMWLDHMGDGRVVVPLQQAAKQWDAAMGRLGLTRPPAALRAAIRRLLDWEWSAPP